MTRTAALVVALLVGTTSLANAEDPRTLLATHTVSGRMTRDEIPLAREAEDAERLPRIDQLILVVDGDLRLVGVTIVTSSGKSFRPRVAHRFTGGSASRAIALPEPGVPRAIALRYRMKPDASATVRVFGVDVQRPVRARTVAAPATAGTGRVSTIAERVDSTRTVTAETGWRLLGAQTVEGRRDADVIRVPPGLALGSTTQLAIVARGGDLELQELRLHFPDGATAEIGTRYVFREASPERIIALPEAHAGQPIRTIQLRYGAMRGRGKTRVEIWAR